MVSLKKNANIILIFNGFVPIINYTSLAFLQPITLTLYQGISHEYPTLLILKFHIFFSHSVVYIIKREEKKKIGTKRVKDVDDNKHNSE
jgi:hypothetical protein